MRTLLLIILAGLHTPDPRVDLVPFESFKACRALAIKENGLGYYDQCAGPLRDNYPAPPPLRTRKHLRVEPKEAKLSETFCFHRPTMDSCQAEAHELRKDGHKAECYHGGISPIAPAQPKKN